MDTVQRTQLFQAYKDSAKLTPFAGFEMPLWYDGIIPEHLAVRNDVGMFDISHMGRVLITGSEAEQYLNYVITNDASKLTPNSAQYSVMCNEKGGIIDDFVVYRMEPEKFMMVYNASNRRKDFEWLSRHTYNFKVMLEEISDDVAMLAIQGPKAEKTLQKISSENLSTIERFKCGSTRLANIAAFLARTGYTGEDGFEVFIWNAPLTDPHNAMNLWQSILDASKEDRVKPCGLGARDTLRLEAGLSLYGNDIDENTSPLEAGLGFVVKLQKEKFVGKESLQKQKAEGLSKRRVGIKIVGQGIPRPSFEVFSDRNENIGKLTSGTFSPLLKCGIGMAYLPLAQAQEGTPVKVKIRDKMSNAEVVSFPFYNPDEYGARRKSSA